MVHPVPHEISVGLFDHVAQMDPTRDSIHLSCARPALGLRIPVCVSIANRAASTTLRNSAMKPSPVRLTIRPR